MISVGILVLIWNSHSINKNGTNQTIYDRSNNLSLVQFCSIYTWVLGALTIIPTVLIAKRLCMKGTSDNLRKKILKRHITYFFLYMLVLQGIFFDIYDQTTLY